MLSYRFSVDGAFLPREAGSRLQSFSASALSPIVGRELERFDAEAALERQ
jgi:hypothetical protein